MDFEPIWLSLKVSVLSTTIVAIVGIALARLLTRTSFKGRTVVETIILLPLVFPPTVVGFILLLLFGKNGPLGHLLGLFGVQVVFSWLAAVIASAVVSLPLMYQGAKAAFESVDVNLEQVARTLGAGEARVFRTVTLPLGLHGVVSGVVMAFARALGEFGATIMIAGNIPGRTQTLPLAIYSESTSGNLTGAGYLVLVLAALSFSLVYGVNLWKNGLKGGSPSAKDGD